MFHTRLPNISDLSTELPSQRIYIEEENIVKNNNALTKEEKEERIQQIRSQFYNNLYKWQLKLDGDKIISIKLSTLVELVKLIIGRPCFINILDYSCNSPTIYIPQEQRILSQYALQEGDIEMGMNKTKYYGGVNGKLTKTIKRRNNKRRNTKRRNNKKRNSNRKNKNKLRRNE